VSDWTLEGYYHGVGRSRKHLLRVVRDKKVIVDGLADTDATRKLVKAHNRSLATVKANRTRLKKKWEHRLEQAHKPWTEPSTTTTTT